MQGLIKNVNALFVQSCMMVLALWFFALITFFHLLNKFSHCYCLYNYLFFSVRPEICLSLQLGKLGSSRLQLEIQGKRMFASSPGSPLYPCFPLYGHIMEPVGN